MICDNCIKAGEVNSLNHLKRATHWHEKCEGCVCQHKTGQGWVKVEGVPTPLMQTQSPQVQSLPTLVGKYEKDKMYQLSVACIVTLVGLL